MHIYVYREHQTSSITVSVDGVWQRRGSGRSYDSLTGNLIDFISPEVFHYYICLDYSSPK